MNDRRFRNISNSYEGILFDIESRIKEIVAVLGNIESRDGYDKFCLEYGNAPHVIAYDRPLLLLIWNLLTWNGLNKINFDGSAKARGRSSGGGAMIRDHSGDFIACYSKDFGIGSNNRAELLALFDSIKLALDIGLDKIHLEWDSKLVVSLINGSWSLDGA